MNHSKGDSNRPLSIPARQALHLQSAPGHGLRLLPNLVRSIGHLLKVLEQPGHGPGHLVRVLL